MQTTDTIQFPAPELVKDDWNFLEVWVDSMLSPPYILLLLGDKTKGCYVFDPAEQYRLVKAFSDKNAMLTIGLSIAATLEAHGFKIEWNGDSKTRINIPNFNWKRRRQDRKSEVFHE